MPSTTIRVNTKTRDRLTQIAAEDFDGATIDETIRRLADAHWQQRCVESWDELREKDPHGWRAETDDESEDVA